MNGHNEKLEKIIQRYIDLQRERAVIKQTEQMPEDLKTRVIAYYNNEINEIMSNDYLYDKINGLKTGGII